MVIDSYLQRTSSSYLPPSASFCPATSRVLFAINGRSPMALEVRIKHLRDGIEPQLPWRRSDLRLSHEFGVSIPRHRHAHQHAPAVLACGEPARRCVLFDGIPVFDAHRDDDLYHSVPSGPGWAELPPAGHHRPDRRGVCAIVERFGNGD